MGARDCSRMDSMRAAVGQAGEGESSLKLLEKYKYPILGAFYVLGTGFAFWRIHRQPYPLSLKGGQYETVFKGTTLVAVVTGIAVGGKGNRARSVAEREEESRA